MSGPMANVENSEVAPIDGMRGASTGFSTEDRKCVVKRRSLATMVIDHRLRLQSFTPASVDFFHAQKPGQRPNLIVADVVSTFPGLKAQIERVLETCAQEELVVHRAWDGAAFLASITPLQNESDGSRPVLVTIDAFAEAQVFEVEFGDSQRAPSHALASDPAIMERDVPFRARNVLSVVRAIARQTARMSTTIDEFTASFYNRIDAVGRTFNMSMRTASRLVDLHELVTEELLAQTIDAYEPRITIDGADLKLCGQQSELFALAILELTTNSIRCGALSIEQGVLSIKWRVVNRDGGSCLLFQWHETGAFDPQDITSLQRGLELVRGAFQYEWSAETTLAFETTGLECEIILPLRVSDRSFR